MRYKRLPGEPNILRIPRGGPPADVECPLRGEEEILFDECLECEHHDIDCDNFCMIKEEEHQEASRKEQEETEREYAEWKATKEIEDRKMQEEMEAWRNEMEKRGKEWQKEYQKEEEEYEKLEEERKERFRESLVSLYGEEMIDFCERTENRESEESNEDEEEEEDEDES